MSVSRPRPGTEAVSLWKDSSIQVLFAACFAGFLSFSISMAAVPVWAAQQGHHEALVGAITGVMLGATVLTQFLSVRLLDVFDERALLATGLVLLGSPMPLLLLTSNFVVILAVSAVRGIGFAIVTVVGALAITRVAPSGRQGEAVGIFGLAAAIPMTIGIAGGAALALQGFFPAVALLGALPALAAPLLGSVRQAGPDRTGAPRVSLPSLARRIWVPTVTVLIVTAVGGGIMTLLPLIRPTGILAPMAIFLLCLIAAMVRWRIGAVLDSRAPQRPLLILIGCGILGLAAAAAGFFLAMGTAPAAALIMLGFGVFGIAYGGVQTVTLDMSMRLSPGADQPGASAIWNAAFDTGTAFGASTFTALGYSMLGPSGTLAISAAVMTVAALLLSLRVSRTAPPAFQLGDR